MLTIKRLDKGHDISEFCSFEKDLENFLKEDAFDNQAKNISVTYLLFSDNVLIGYVSLLNDRLDLNPTLKKYFRDKGVLYSSLPALKIGRLCIDDRYLRKGYGTLLLKFCVLVSKKKINKFSGCRFITLDSKSKAVGFYRKHEFNILKEKKNSVYLYLDVNRLS